MIAYFMFKFMHMLVLILPRRLGYWIGSRVADLDYLFRIKMRNAVNSNIRHVLTVTKGTGQFPESLVRKYTRDAFRNFAKYLVDFFRFSTLNSENIHKFVKVEGLEYINQAFNRGKGIIGLSAHLGNWEQGASVMASIGIPIHVVALDHENTRINRLFINQRAMKGVGVIPVGVKVRRYLSVLKNNQLIALVGDRLTSEAGIETNFFNKPTQVPRGPATLSLRTGALIVPGFMIRTKEDNYRLIFEKPIDPEEFRNNSTNNVDSNVITKRINIVDAEKRLTQHITKILEKYIGQYLSQWFLFYKIWP